MLPSIQCLNAVDAIALLTGNSHVHAMQLDLSSMDSVRQFAEKFDRQAITSRVFSIFCPSPFAHVQN